MWHSRFVILSLQLSASHIQAFPQTNQTLTIKDESKIVGRYNKCDGGLEERLEHYESLASKGHRQWADNEKVEDFIALSAFKRGKNVLDLGTGIGTIAIAAKKRAGRRSHVIGIDFSPTAIKQAEHFAVEAHQQVSFIHGDIDNIESILKDGIQKFDVITCSLAFQYIDDPVSTLVKWAKFLRPGGRIVFDVLPREVRPDFGAILDALKQMGETSFLQSAQDTVRSEADVAVLIEQAGLESHVKKPRVYIFQQLQKAQGEKFIRSMVHRKEYSCLDTNTLLKKALENYDTLFKRRQFIEGVVTHSDYYFEAVATKPDGELK